MKTFQRILFFVLGSLSLFIGLAITIGFIAALATHSIVSVDLNSIIALFALPSFLYVGWRWIRQAKQMQ